VKEEKKSEFMGAPSHKSSAFGLPSVQLRIAGEA
jgi:hypothetical protein